MVARWSEPAIIVERTYYQAGGSGLLDSAYSQLFVVSSDGGRALSADGTVLYSWWHHLRWDNRQ